MHSSKIMGGFTTVVEMLALESHKRHESPWFPMSFPSIHWKHGGLTTSESTARVGALMRMGSMIFPLGMGWGSSDVKSGSWGSFMKSRIQVGQGSCWQLVDFRKAAFFFGSWPSWPLDSKTRGWHQGGLPKLQVAMFLTNTTKFSWRPTFLPPNVWVS